MKLWHNLGTFWAHFGILPYFESGRVAVKNCRVDFGLEKEQKFWTVAVLLSSVFLLVT